MVRDRTAWFKLLARAGPALRASDRLGLMVLAEWIESGPTMYAQALRAANDAVVVEGGRKRKATVKERRRIAGLFTLNAALRALLADYDAVPFLIGGVLAPATPARARTLAIATWFHAWQTTSLSKVRGWIERPPAGTDEHLVALWRARCELLEVLPSIDRAQDAPSIARATLPIRDRADGSRPRDRTPKRIEEERCRVIGEILADPIRARIGRDGLWRLDARALRTKVRDEARGTARSAPRCKPCRARGRAWSKANPRAECADCRALESGVRKTLSLDWTATSGRSLGERIGDGAVRVDAIARVRTARDVSDLRSVLERVQYERMELKTRSNARALRAVRANLVALMLDGRTARDVARSSGCAESRISEAYKAEFAAVCARLKSDPRLAALLEGTSS